MRICFEISGGRVTPTSLDTTHDGHLSLKLTPPIDGTLLLGSARAKIRNGEGRVKLSEVGCGVFTPTVICDEASLVLPRLSVQLGCATLSEPCELICDMGARICALEEGEKQNRDEIKRLTDAVFGKKLFEEG